MCWILSAVVFMRPSPAELLRLVMHRVHEANHRITVHAKAPGSQKQIPPIPTSPWECT